MISHPLDLGYTNSRLSRIVPVVHTVLEGKVPPQIQFFVRVSDNPYQWNETDDSSWLPIEMGKDLGSRFRGRYVQIKAWLYPSDTGLSAPILQELQIYFEPDLPPPPPSIVQAIPQDGAVLLQWKPSPDRDVAGYVVYYGTASGEYFGTDAALGVSPINVGLRTQILIDGLQNGRVYYFAIAAYDRADPPHIGEFSREIAARPLRMER